MEKKDSIIKTDKNVEEIVEKDTGAVVPESPEKEAHFQSLFDAQDTYADLRDQADFGEFQTEWSIPVLEHKEWLLNNRKRWIAIKKEGAEFGDFLKKKIYEYLEDGDTTGVFKCLGIYEYGNYPGSVEFLSGLLSWPRIWNDSDPSNARMVLDFIGDHGSQESIAVIKKYIKNILSPGYKREDHLQADLEYAVLLALVKLLRDHELTVDEVLSSLAEEEPTFRGWLEILKAKLADHGGYLNENSLFDFEEFDEAKEMARLAELEAEYEELKKSEIVSSKTIKEMSADQVNEENIKENYDKSVLKLDEILQGDVRKKEVSPKSVRLNFYGRFLPKLEKPTPITGENWSSSLLAAIGANSRDQYLGFLAGVAEGKNLETETKLEGLSPEQIKKIVVLVFSRALCLAVLEGRLEEGLAEIEKARSLFAKFRDSTQNKIPSFLADYAMTLLDSWKRSNLARRVGESRAIELPESAKSFLIYHAWNNKAREIPDFSVLLAEKIRWIMADHLSSSGPSILEMTEVLDLYDDGKRLYKSVEEEDIPIYWEANDKLTDLDADRAVVFGRDGRFFFTALKAFDFGIGSKKLKYVIITRRIQATEDRDKIAKYLKQNGIDLDFTFIDTGYRGSIPELAIRSLASSVGIGISRDEIDKRIALLSKTGDEVNRRELSRGKPGENDRYRAIDAIEERRGHSIQSPEYLDLDKKGKIRPRVQPTPISEQLKAWVTEHASFRNFAPRLNPDKQMAYLETNPLEGYEFVQDFRGGGAIGTHPMELWRDRAGKEVLVKGGPAHTLRADFLGYQFLEEFGLTTHQTELLTTNQGKMSLKMEVLKDWKSGGLHLEGEYKNSAVIKSGLLIDALLGQYDRTPWNFMFKEGPFGRDVAFIDNGASAFSRARGGHKGFPEHFDIDQLRVILSNP